MKIKSIILLGFVAAILGFFAYKTYTSSCQLEVLKNANIKLAEQKLIIEQITKNYKVQK